MKYAYTHRPRREQNTHTAVRIWETKTQSHMHWSTPPGQMLIFPLPFSPYIQVVGNTHIHYAYTHRPKREQNTHTAVRIWETKTQSHMHWSTPPGQMLIFPLPFSPYIQVVGNTHIHYAYTHRPKREQNTHTAVRIWLTYALSYTPRTNWSSLFPSLSCVYPYIQVVGNAHIQANQLNATLYGVCL